MQRANIISLDPVADCLADCYRRMLSQIDIGEKQNETPITSNALDGKEMIGASGNDSKEPLTKRTLPHDT